MSNPSENAFLTQFLALCWEVTVTEATTIISKLQAIEHLMNTQVWTEALLLAHNLVGTNPRVSKAHLLVAYGNYQIGQYALARKAAIATDLDQLLAVKDLSDLGQILYKLDEGRRAVHAFRRATERQQTPVTLANLGAVLSAQGEREEAYRVLKKAVEIDSKCEFALGNLSGACYDIGRLKEAEATARALLALNPDNAGGIINLANTLLSRKLWREASDLYIRRLETIPDCWATRTKLMHCLAQDADWTQLSAQNQFFKENIGKIAAGPSAPNPWVLLSVSDNPALHQAAAASNARSLNAISPAMPKSRKSKSDRLTIGFFSADFYNHPTTQLILSLLKNLDRTKFCVHAFSFGPRVLDEYRTAVSIAVDHFHDVSQYSNEQIAELARAEALDIAIDLNGYTKNHRAAIFAHRAAPLQVQYLGYPGTMMVREIDAVIADEFIIPVEAEGYFSEKVIRLPGFYQINDQDFDPPDQAVSRLEAGLPPSGIILACLNSIHKVNADTFDLWMQIMRRTPNAYIWLFSDNPIARSNIEATAAESGVDPARIVWAVRVSRKEHLARLCNVDLFLDTWPYNSHTTASDALRMHVPIVTCPGRSFASRVCGSLLNALNLTDLIARTPAEYVNVAVRLCENQSELQRLRNILADRVVDSGIFDADVFSRKFEDALLGIWNENTEHDTETYLNYDTLRTPASENAP
jgi:protein O-GlcNAc transferase